MLGPLCGAACRRMEPKQKATDPGGLVPNALFKYLDSAILTYPRIFRYIGNKKHYTHMYIVNK